MNLFLIMNLFLMFFFSGMLVFLINFNILLINLLSVEYMMLMLISSLFFIFNKLNIDLLFIMMFLTFMVTEGVLGLAILVCLIRNFGNMNLMNMFFLKMMNV